MSDSFIACTAPYDAARIVLGIPGRCLVDALHGLADHDVEVGLSEAGGHLGILAAGDAAGLLSCAAGSGERGGDSKSIYELVHFPLSFLRILC